MRGRNDASPGLPLAMMMMMRWFHTHYRVPTRLACRTIPPCRAGPPNPLCNHHHHHLAPGQFFGGKRRQPGKKENYKSTQSSPSRGGSGTQGAVAQFSTGRRCGKWQNVSCTALATGFVLPLFHTPLQAGGGLSHAPGWDRVRLASRPHRSLRHLLRRRLFASAPAPAPAAAGRRYRRALQVVARRFPSF